MADEPKAPSEFDSSYNIETDENIGAWCDEVWEAAGFYSTADPDYTSNGDERWELKYRYTNTPEGKTVRSAGAALPSDAVVVEWKVSGHVHFASGL